VTGVADVIEVRGRQLTAGDGLVLDGSTLYVVNGYGGDEVAVLRLSADATRAQAVGVIRSRRAGPARPPERSSTARSTSSTAGSTRWPPRRTPPSTSRGSVPASRFHLFEGVSARSRGVDHDDEWRTPLLLTSPGREPMGIGVSIFLLAIGAILTFAVNAELSGLDIRVVGVILMICGAVGLLLTMLVFGRRGGTAVVEDRVVRERDVY
jgi:hypothetical protein